MNPEVNLETTTQRYAETSHTDTVPGERHITQFLMLILQKHCVEKCTTGKLTVRDVSTAPIKIWRNIL